MIVIWEIPSFSSDRLNEPWRIPCNSLELSGGRVISARQAALLAAVLFIFGPILWFIPPMVTAIVRPDPGQVFPQLTRPEEASYVALGMELLPVGTIGILISAIFAATMSCMDSGFNRHTGIIFKNFYQRIIRPGADEAEMLVAGKLVTLLLGVGIITSAMWLSQLETIGLFDIMLQLGALIGLPLNVPMFWGTVIKKSPDWAGWATALVSLTVAWTARTSFDAEWV